MDSSQPPHIYDVYSVSGPENEQDQAIFCDAQTMARYIEDYEAKNVSANLFTKDLKSQLLEHAANNPTDCYVALGFYLGDEFIFARFGVLESSQQAFGTGQITYPTTGVMEVFADPLNGYDYLASGGSIPEEFPLVAVMPVANPDGNGFTQIPLREAVNNLTDYTVRPLVSEFTTVVEDVVLNILIKQGLCESLGIDKEDILIEVVGEEEYTILACEVQNLLDSPLSPSGFIVAPNVLLNGNFPDVTGEASLDRLRDTLSLYKKDTEGKVLLVLPDTFASQILRNNPDTDVVIRKSWVVNTVKGIPEFGLGLGVLAVIIGGISFVSNLLNSRIDKRIQTEAERLRIDEERRLIASIDPNRYAPLPKEPDNRDPGTHPAYKHRQVVERVVGLKEPIARYVSSDESEGYYNYLGVNIQNSRDLQKAIQSLTTGSLNNDGYEKCKRAGLLKAMRENGINYTKFDDMPKGFSGFKVGHYQRFVSEDVEYEMGVFLIPQPDNVPDHKVVVVVQRAE